MERSKAHSFGEDDGDKVVGEKLDAPSEQHVPERLRAVDHREDDAGSEGYVLQGRWGGG